MDKLKLNVCFRISLNNQIILPLKKTIVSNVNRIKIMVQKLQEFKVSKKNNPLKQQPGPFTVSIFIMKCATCLK